MTGYKKRSLRFISILLAAIFLSVGHGKLYSFETSGDYEFNRARLIGYLIKNDLTTHHFLHGEVDESRSKAAFSLFLKQLDPQKRFLLKQDVAALKTYQGRIGEELSTGDLVLPDAVHKLMDKRVHEAENMVREILALSFDFSADEAMETDNEKVDWCSGTDELRERWRKLLKLQVLYKYLTMLEDEASKTGEKSIKSFKGKTASAALLKTAVEKVSKNYETLFSRYYHEKTREYYDRYFSAVSRSFDPHSEYMPPASKDDFDISMRGSLEGIGATLTEEDGYVKIQSVVPGGPAFRQGEVEAEDVILKVAEGGREPVDITDMGVKEAVKLIRGKKGTEVSLTIRKPDGSQKIVKIIRDVVQLDYTFAKSMTLEDEKKHRVFGYINLPSFYRDFEGLKNGGGRTSSEDVKKELLKFRDGRIKGLILDLRNNGGGALTDAVAIAGLFIKNGPVVQVKGGNDRTSVLSDDDDSIVYDGPMVVLVNKFSASASEILAGALQDYGRAVIMGGNHTYGKGTVQSIVDLNSSLTLRSKEQYKPLGALRLTIQKFYRVSGETTQYKGVVPDIILPERLKALKSGEQYQDYALPWDTVNPVSYTSWKGLRELMPSLKALSSARVAANAEFGEIEKESSRIAQRQKKTMQTLNLEKAVKEREEDKAFKSKGKKTLHSMEEGEPEPEPRMSMEERSEKWKKEISSDVYVLEAESVLGDILDAEAANAAR